MVIRAITSSKTVLPYVYGHKGHALIRKYFNVRFRFPVMGLSLIRKYYIVRFLSRFRFPVMRAIPSSENILLYVSGPVSDFWS